MPANNAGLFINSLTLKLPNIDVAFILISIGPVLVVLITSKIKQKLDLFENGIIFFFDTKMDFVLFLFLN